MLYRKYLLWILAAARLAVAGASSPTQLRKRSDEVHAFSLDLTFGVEESFQGVYITNVSVGTPPQPQTLFVDQSILTILLYSHSNDCMEETAGACGHQGYDPSQSSTQAIVSSDDVEYASLWADETHKTNNKGNTFRDDFTFHDKVLTNKTFLLAVDSASPQLGLGTSIGPASGVHKPGTNTSVGFDGLHRPLSLVTQMADQGLIRSSAFSIALENDILSRGDGVLMLGAIDTAKYTGSLTSLKAQPYINTTRLSNVGIALTSLRVVSPSGIDELFSETPLFVPLAIGSSFTVLPEPMARLIYAEAGAEWNATALAATLPCSRSRSGAYLSFQFHGTAGPIVNISLADMMTPYPEFPSCHPRAGGPGCRLDKPGLCQLLIAPHFQADPPILVSLGDPFLRKAYTVYDQENGQFGIAQAKYSTASKVVPFESRGATMPSSTPGPEADPPIIVNEADADYSRFSVASIPRLLAAPGILDDASKSTGHPPDTVIGLSVAISLGVLAALFILVGIWVVVLKRPVECFGRAVWPKSHPANRHELESSVSRSVVAELPCPSGALEERKRKAEDEVTSAALEKIGSPTSELSTHGSHSSVGPKVECGSSQPGPRNL